MSRTLNDLRQLARQVAALQEQARSLRVFPGNRSLLECPNCGLQEDVLCTGQLITCRLSGESQDTGLRFQELRGNRFHCPACGAGVQEE